MKEKGNTIYMKELCDQSEKEIDDKDSENRKPSHKFRPSKKLHDERRSYKKLERFRRKRKTKLIET